MSERPPYPGMPRWLKVSAIIIGIALVLVIGFKLLTGVGGGPGEHGPGRDTPPTEHGVQQP